MSWNRVTALDALRGSDLLGLGISANQLRHNLHPEGVVTYALRGSESPSSAELHNLSADEDGSISFSNILDLEYFSLDALKSLFVARRKQFSGVTFRHLPISTRHRFAQDLPAFSAGLSSLAALGLASIHLDVQSGHSSFFTSESLVLLLKAAVESRFFISASVTIGNEESLETRIDTLERLRAAQEGSNAIHAVLLLVHHSNAIGARREEDATAVDYLKTLAVTRLLLDNVAHIQADWSVMGPKVLELALRFGADDAGVIPRSQTASAEPSHHGGESELRRIIRDAGFRPVERDAFFRQSLLH